MDQYKLVREHIVVTVQDRIANNRLLLTISTLIVGGEGYIVKDLLAAVVVSLSPTAIGLLSVLSLTGAGLAFIWDRWNRSYKTSLRVRYDLLREMEAALPMRPFARELELREKYSYVPISDVIGELASMFFVVFAVQLPFLAHLWVAGNSG